MSVSNTAEMTVDSLAILLFRHFNVSSSRFTYADLYVRTNTRIQCFDVSYAYSICKNPVSPCKISQLLDPDKIIL